ncbi:MULTISPECIES: hypothetical protein [unclassified Ensifer]|nr:MULTISPECIES: hypothetical protein [unclassified Ensifer]MBD9596311.1 hypothetical protein [Ensifer sp. ENS05]SDN18399.1 hypothetical protein SAMN05216328_12092 [Ensifer sp. YR511]
MLLALRVETTMGMAQGMGIAARDTFLVHYVIDLAVQADSLAEQPPI